MRKVLIKTANKQNKTAVKRTNDNGRGKQMSIIAKKVMSYKDIRMSANIQASNPKTSQSIKIAKITRTI
ncbi:hypothetical protein [Helicobacter trogontum]|uniref:hypothetical protein n=1 Tax=Helicobacter trogontum TaxID=50960 RepID=UPI000CF0792E|nr:hypothetical protein [Helicobacter trogontum]